MDNTANIIVGLVTVAGLAVGVAVADEPLGGRASDPVEMGWMQGFPPPENRVIRNVENGFDFPMRRWAYSHWREFKPTANVWRGRGPVSPLLEAKQDLSKIPVSPPDGRETTWEDVLVDTYVDGVVVLHRGKIVEERYFGVLEPHRPHLAMSMTKSFTGLMAATLVEEGRIDPDAKVADYVPELAATGYGDATVRQVMDMLVSVVYSEDYTDPNADVYALTYAGGVLVPPAAYTGPDNIYGYLQTIEKDQEHGDVFAYRSTGTQVLSWIMNKVTGKPDEQLLSEMIWQKLGVEQDAYYSIDSMGTTYTAGGLNTTVRDLARFGEMVRLKGHYNGQQIVPAAVIEDIMKGGDREKYAHSNPSRPGGSYRSQWWISHDEDGSFSALGFNNQRLYINPSAEVVIAWYGSHWSPSHRTFSGLADAGTKSVAAHLKAASEHAD